MDVDKSGDITFAEFSAIMPPKASGPGMRSIDDFLAATDKDKDGHLSTVS